MNIGPNLNLHSYSNKFFNVEEIMKKLTDIVNSNILASEVSRIFKEPKKEIIHNILLKLERGQFLSLVEKTLTYQNMGGLTTIVKKGNQDVLIKKTLGGVFFYLVKLEGELNKDELKEIFKTDKKFLKDQRKILSDLTKMSI